MSLKLLFIDPDKKWLKECSQYFTAKGYKVDCATTGKKAQEFISKALGKNSKHYFQIILNLDVESYSGPQVLKFIQTKFRSADIILCLNDMKLIEDGIISSVQIKRMGVSDSFVKPIDLDDLLSAVEGQQSLEQLTSLLPKEKKNTQEDETEIDVNEENYFAVPITEFIPSKKILFNVYIKINDNKYLKILNAGDHFDKERINNYKIKKSIVFLYFHRRDRRKYIRLCNVIANKMIESKIKKTATTNKVLQVIAENFLEEINFSGIRPHIIESGKEYCSNVLNMICKDEQLYKHVRNMKNINPTEYNHAYLTCLFSVMIVNEFKWKTAATLETAGISALLHDIGKLDLETSKKDIAYSEMNEEEKEAYLQHPAIAAELLDGNRLISTSIKQVIRQHHEFSDGSGFPEGLKDEKLLTMSKILSFTNFFVDFMNDKELSPHEAIKIFYKDQDLVKKFNSQVLEKFITAFQDPNKKSKDTDLQSNSRLVKNKVF